jgi:hypothetical protein
MTDKLVDDVSSVIDMRSLENTHQHVQYLGWNGSKYVHLLINEATVTNAI